MVESKTRVKERQSGQGRLVFVLTQVHVSSPALHCWQPEQEAVQENFIGNNT